MAHQRRKHSHTVNMRLPDDLFPKFLEHLQSLSPSLKTDYLRQEVSSKFVSADTDPAAVRQQRAINKWLSAERDNEATNERLLLTPSKYNILPRVSFGSFVSHCRDLITKIIGETAPVESLIGTFSGGASTSRNRTESYPASKYLGEAHVTSRALELFSDISDEMPGWLGYSEDGMILKPRVVPGNVMFTVPKKTDIDRVACKEPDINMFLQKGIGDYLRKRLRRVGINLNDQGINRSLAREGSVTGLLATLDLSSASDSVTTGLVQLLLPECWHTLLDSVRSPTTIIDGEEHRNQMFSSMGNGFTFELESLLFYAIVRTTCLVTGTPGVVSVYGDDIICPTEIVDLLMWVLSYFGFQVNPDKSHWTGGFRESCGGHYHYGFDITPFYIKEPVDTLPNLIDLANKLRHWGSGTGSIIDPEVEPIWLWLKGQVPRCLWGGGDTAFKYQLVSRDTPEARISEETKSLKTELGGFFHWLNATWDRAQLGDGVTTSRTSWNLKRFRIRRVRSSTVPQLPALFLHEIG